MVLFQNIFITDSHAIGNGTYQNRDMAKNFDKLDIYKYCLASLSNLYPWKRVILKTKLDTKYKEREHEFIDFVKNEFGKYDLIIEMDRNETQDQWKKDFDLLNDNLIWFSANHDHAYLDNDSSYFRNFVDGLRNEDGAYSIQFSHWPEMIYAPFFYNIPASLKNNVIEVKNTLHHSLQIITKDLYKYYWFESELPKDQIWGRTDNFISDIFRKEIKSFISLKEFCRHFDGYQHCGIKYPNSVVPVLEIPNGFFDNNIKINYGPIYKDNYTNLNPKSETLKIYDPEGTDYWYSKKFIPSFWKSRISEFLDNYCHVNEIELDDSYVMKHLRLLSHLPEHEIKKAILKTYLE